MRNRLARQLATAIMFNNPSTVLEIKRQIVDRCGMGVYRKVKRDAIALARG